MQGKRGNPATVLSTIMNEEFQVLNESPEGRIPIMSTLRKKKMLPL